MVCPSHTIYPRNYDITAVGRQQKTISSIVIDGTLPPLNPLTGIFFGLPFLPLHLIYDFSLSYWLIICSRSDTDNIVSTITTALAAPPATILLKTTTIPYIAPEHPVGL
jgi:hypothetical protein